MAKLNGNLKWVALAATVIGLVVLFADKVWYTSGVNAKLNTNSTEDEKIHPTVLENEKEIIGVKKDVEQNTKRIAEFITEQKVQTSLLEEILRKP